jgi:hypothetical protein
MPFAWYKEILTLCSKGTQIKNEKRINGGNIISQPEIFFAERILILRNVPPLIFIKKPSYLD